MGSGGQQRTHQRPFFYVQPPSQPYYMYQHWQMNNPYGQYALPGGFNFGRPCLNPYQYMQYPGFVFPHAPLYPMDYRRVFEPRFPSPHWDNSARYQPPPQPPQPPGHRETASSEVQTDPSDAITKLIECLDKMQASNSQGTDRELDSGIASHSSAMFSPTEEKKAQQQSHDLNKNESCLETPTSTFSTTAVYDGDSSHRSLEVLSPRECWAGDVEEELPLDSSSVQEESNGKVEEQVVPIESAQEVVSIQPDTAATEQNVPTCEELREPKHNEANLEEKIVQDLQVDPSFQILKLPFELASEAKGMNRLAQSPYYYNYLSMQSTHERMSVLSPSLDELSSRDEMFSTDLEEVELVQRPVLAGGRRLAEVVCGGGDEVDEIWAFGSKRFVCACCGKSLPRGAANRSKVHCTKMYLDEGESEEDGRYMRGCEQPIRVVVRKHTVPRKSQPLPPRLTKSWSRRGPTRDQAELDQSQERRDTQEEESTEGKEHHRVSQDLPQRRLVYHRPRDDEDEPPPLHWDRGSAMRDPPC
ncbi:bucky ball-like [Periophthalmus magnuspinnatus]|nr:bucky ball-like [Periophthalmus magnuspinnatus]